MAANSAMAIAIEIMQLGYRALNDLPPFFWVNRSAEQQTEIYGEYSLDCFKSNRLNQA
jgi:hypothetical protein